MLRTPMTIAQPNSIGTGTVREQRALGRPADTPDRRLEVTFCSPSRIGQPDGY